MVHKFSKETDTRTFDDAQGIAGSLELSQRPDDCDLVLATKRVVTHLDDSLFTHLWNQGCHVSIVPLRRVDEAKDVIESGFLVPLGDCYRTFEARLGKEVLTHRRC